MEREFPRLRLAVLARERFDLAHVEAALDDHLRDERAQRRLARLLHGENFDLTLTGHSLGGGLAQFAAANAIRPVRRVVTFNSAGLF